MTNSSDDNDTDYPDWWDEKPSKSIKSSWQEQVPNYLAANDLEAGKATHSMDLVKAMIPFMKIGDGRWYKFPRDQFNITTHKCHEALYHAIRNELDSLKYAAEKKRNETIKAQKETQKKKNEEAQIQNE